jgi:hypothetical protein
MGCAQHSQASLVSCHAMLTLHTPATCARVQNGALNFEELQSMASQNNLDRPGGLDEAQFVHKFSTRISREGKYQTKVCAPPFLSRRVQRSMLAPCVMPQRAGPSPDRLSWLRMACRMCSWSSIRTATGSCRGWRWVA